MYLIELKWLFQNIARIKLFYVYNLHSLRCWSSQKFAQGRIQLNWKWDKVYRKQLAMNFKMLNSPNICNHLTNQETRKNYALSTKLTFPSENKDCVLLKQNLRRNKKYRILSDPQCKQKIIPNSAETLVIT